MTYTEIATGQEVEAKHCGHGGMVLDLMNLGRQHSVFEEGDYIIRYPETFEGERREKIIKAKDFPKQYRLVGAKAGVDWAALGWKV